jgi:hypothetical protein
MTIPGIRFISSASPGSGFGVGVGLSSIRGPTGPAGSFGGPQGVSGLQGYQGLIGYSTGTQGLQGLQGLVGPTGSPGTIGINGVQGSQGTTGAPGNIGSQGLQGLMGSTGSIGYQGGAGMGFIVFANTNSYTGLNTIIATGGNIGQFVLVLGGDLFVYAGTGSGYTGPGNSYGYAGDVTDESKLYGSQGPVGMQGNVGAQGFQGLAGSTGSIGLQGLIGATGSIGLQGLIGATGSIGLQGLQGLIGPTGSIGLQGPTGSIGLQGSTGSIGQAGYNAVATYNYKYSSTTTFGNPGQGLFRLNNSNMGISTGMYINSTDGAGLGNDLGRVFGDLNTYGAPGKRGFLKIQKAEDYTWYFVYEIQNITQQSTGATGWYSFDVNCILPDANFTNNDDVYLSLIPAGPPGSTGPTGGIGVQGFQGYTGSIGYQGFQGSAGMGFTVFASTNSYTGLNSIIATGGNIGQFVLVLGGDLFVYSGTGSGYTGPGNSYGYAGDVTDESKLLGMQGYQGATGPGFSTISNYGNNKLLLSTGTSSNSAIAYDNLNYDGTTLSAPGIAVSTLAVTGTFQFGTPPQIFYPHGANGFSVNENFDASNSATQTAYHYTSGDQTRSIVFDIAVTNQYTTMFGTHGNNTSNEFIIGSETANTDFIFKQGLGIQPINLAGGTELFKISSLGSITIPIGNAPENLTDPGDAGQLAWDDSNFYIHNNTSWQQIPYGGFTGPQGLVGSTGMQGYQGFQGETGMQGYQGLIGNTGSTGSIGYQGFQGLAGYTSGKIYYLNYSVTGSTGGYSQLSPYASPSPTGYTHTITLPTAGQSGTLASFITDINDPGVLFIPPGIWNSTCFLSASLGGGGSPSLTDLQTYIQFFRYTSTGSLVYLERSSIQPVTTSSASPYQLSAQFLQTPLSLDDRIVMKIIGNNTSSPSKSITLSGYFQDNTYSNVITSFSTIQAGATGSIGPQGIVGPTGAGGALGYYGSFFDTTIQAITVANTGYVMTYNNTLESNGVFVSNNSHINFQHGGVYNLQFSAQFDKTDSGTDTIDVWLRQNGVNVPWTNTRLTSVGNNDKMVAAWNFIQTLSANDYLELVWMSNDIGFRIYSETGSIAPVRPGIPSVILTVQQVMNTQIGPTGPSGESIVGGKSTQFIFNQSGSSTGSNQAFTYLESPTGGLIYAGSSIIPIQTNTHNLGGPDNLWKSIYISTGTIFIGPTGTLGLDNNGVISSAGGFASPFVTVGSTNPGNGIKLYNNNNKLWFQNQSGATGPVSNWNITNTENIYFTGAHVGIGTDVPIYPLTVKGTIYCEGLTGTNLPIGPQGSAGTNGSSSSLTLYLDTVGGAYSATALTGTLMMIPDQTTQTTITSGNRSNTTINIANFISNSVPSNIIQGGNWDLNLFGLANASSAVSFYYDIFYVDSDGVSNQTPLALGTGSSSVFLPTSQSLTTNSLYVPATVLPDTSHRILIKIYLIFSGNNRNATLEFRNGTVSHLHTTILSPILAGGQNTQIIFNQSGAYTGSNNLTFTNNKLSTSNLSVTSSNNSTGSATGALVVTGGVNVNGESVFNNIVYAPQLNPNFINRGNPGQASPLLLSNYNTVHYYSTTSATGFVDISTTMVENAVYEIEVSCYGASASNDDMFLYPNYNTSFGSTTFYNVYTQSSGSPSIQYASQNQNGFYFDYVGGAIGWEPVCKIKIYNNRSAKKIKVEGGDTTAIVNGQGYWTSGSGFTSNSVTNIVYDTATQWSNIGRLTFSSNGNITFTNWNIWVKRIM